MAGAPVIVSGGNEQCTSQLVAAHLRVRSPIGSIFRPGPLPRFRFQLPYFGTLVNPISMTLRSTKVLTAKEPILAVPMLNYHSELLYSLTLITNLLFPGECGSTLDMNFIR